MLACLGYIDQDVVAAVSSFVAARIAKTGREPQQEGLVRGPRLSRRALAATQGEDKPEVRGVCPKGVPPQWSNDVIEKVTTATLL